MTVLQFSAGQSQRRRPVQAAPGPIAQVPRGAFTFTKMKPPDLSHCQVPEEGVAPPSGLLLKRKAETAKYVGCQDRQYDPEQDDHYAVRFWWKLLDARGDGVGYLSRLYG